MKEFERVLQIFSNHEIPILFVKSQHMRRAKTRVADQLSICNVNVKVKMTRPNRYVVDNNTESGTTGLIYYSTLLQKYVSVGGLATVICKTRSCRIIPLS